MEIWKTPLLFCAVVVTVTSAIMRDEISSESIVLDAYKNAHLKLRSVLENYTKMLKDRVNDGISTVSSDCKEGVIQILSKAETDMLIAFAASMRDLRYECTASPPSVEHASVVVRKVNATHEVAMYTCDEGYTSGRGEKEVWCDGNYGVWNSATLHCIECFTDAFDYQGRKSITQGGIQCQRWDSQSPHKHKFGSSYFPENNVSLAENYCRSTTLLEPWCHTTDPNMEWDYCGIPKCTRTYENDCGLPQPVTNAKPHYTYMSNGARANYVCLSLSGSTQNSYCPVSQCTTTGWTAVSISCGEHDCFRNSTEYTGKRTCTVSGRICQAWKSKKPHDHGYFGSDFPEGSADKAGNYCRDPEGSGTPWCFTTDPDVRYETCDIPQCHQFP